MLGNTKEVYSTKDIVKEVELIQRIFDKYGVRLILTYGLLLGLYRDKKMLPNDDDIDFCVIDKIDLKTRKAIAHDLFDVGFMPQNISFNTFGKMEPIDPFYSGDDKTGIIVCEKYFKYTIFFFKEVYCDIHEKEYICFPKPGAYPLIAIPSKFFKKLGSIKFNRLKLLTPSPIKEYLTESYQNWKDKSLRDHSPLWTEVHTNNHEDIRDT